MRRVYQCPQSGHSDRRVQGATQYSGRGMCNAEHVTGQQSMLHVHNSARESVQYHPCNIGWVFWYRT